MVVHFAWSEVRQPCHEDTPDLYEGLYGCWMQVVIVQYGGKWFQTVPLTLDQWAACVGVGALSLVVRAALRLIPTNKQ